VVAEFALFLSAGLHLAVRAFGCIIGRRAPPSESVLLRTEAFRLIKVFGAVCGKPR
jgi:hypothetical protein